MIAIIIEYNSLGNRNSCQKRKLFLLDLTSNHPDPTATQLLTAERRMYDSIMHVECHMIMQPEITQLPHGSS